VGLMDDAELKKAALKIGQLFDMEIGSEKRFR
jgi:hypothetical protein